MAVLSLLMTPVLFARVSTGLREMALLDVPIFAAATVSVVSFYAFSQGRLRRLEPGGRQNGRWRRMRGIPAALAVGIGISFSNASAVLAGALGRRTPFVRTPKYGISGTGDGWRAKSYRMPAGALPALEFGLGAVMAAAAVYAASEGVAASVPFLLLFAAGYLYVGGRSLLEIRRPVTE